MVAWWHALKVKRDPQGGRRLHDRLAADIALCSHAAVQGGELIGTLDVLIRANQSKLTCSTM